MEGRVEVCHNQTWWAVSGWYWYFRDATVVCRHFHYPANCKLCHKNTTNVTTNNCCCIFSCLERWFLLVLDFRCVYWYLILATPFFKIFAMHTGAIPMSTALFGRGNATILVYDFGCTGREQSLQQCTPSNYSISSYYSYGYSVYNRYVITMS